MKSSWSSTEFAQNNYDVTSILGYVIKKNSSCGAQHGPSERRRMFYTAKQVLKKARQKKHGNHPTILSRWYASESYRNSLYDLGWREKKHNVVRKNRLGEEESSLDTSFDADAGRDRRCCAVHPGDRAKNSKHLILTINAGPQRPLNRRPVFAQARRECKRLHDEHLARTQQDYRTIPRSQQVRQRKGQQVEGNEEYDHAVDPKTGWRFYKGSRGNLQTALSSLSNWDRTHWKTSNWDSQHSSRPDDL